MLFFIADNIKTADNELNTVSENKSQWADLQKVPFNPILNKNAQKAIFSRKMTKSFDSQICFNNKYNCTNLTFEFLLIYLVKNIQLNARNRFSRKL